MLLSKTEASVDAFQSQTRRATLTCNLQTMAPGREADCKAGARVPIRGTASALGSDSQGAARVFSHRWTRGSTGP